MPCGHMSLNSPFFTPVRNAVISARQSKCKCICTCKTDVVAQCAGAWIRGRGAASPEMIAPGDAASVSARRSRAVCGAPPGRAGWLTSLRSGQAHATACVTVTIPYWLLPKLEWWIRQQADKGVGNASAGTGLRGRYGNDQCHRHGTVPAYGPDSRLLFSGCGHRDNTGCRRRSQFAAPTHSHPDQAPARPGKNPWHPSVAAAGCHCSGANGGPGGSPHQPRRKRPARPQAPATGPSWWRSASRMSSVMVAPTAARTASGVAPAGDR
jgi:hypothetical protein